MQGGFCCLESGIRAIQEQHQRRDQESVRFFVFEACSFWLFGFGPDVRAPPWARPSSVNSLFAVGRDATSRPLGPFCCFSWHSAATANDNQSQAPWPSGFGFRGIFD